MFHRNKDALAVLVVGAALLASTHSAAQPYDLILRNARIVDGTGTPWYRGDVAIKGNFDLTCPGFSGCDK